jgi:hypothetical protein
MDDTFSIHSGVECGSAICADDLEVGAGRKYKQIRKTKQIHRVERSKLYGIRHHGIKDELEFSNFSRYGTEENLLCDGLTDDRSSLQKLVASCD